MTIEIHIHAYPKRLQHDTSWVHNKQQINQSTSQITPHRFFSPKSELATPIPTP
jgi:hypothetical protein